MDEVERGLLGIPERRRQAEKTPEPELRDFFVAFLDRQRQETEAMAADSEN